MQIEFKSRYKLKKWLKNAVNVSVLTIALSSQVSELQTNISSPSKLYSAFSERVELLPKGRYFVSYEDAGKEDDDLSINSYYWVNASEQKLKHGMAYGSLSEFKSELVDFEYIILSRNQSYENQTVEMFILMPTDPLEISALKSILS
ncbi:hypothetical protein [Vibrio sp. SSH13-20]|uniref:hypothetical protein n=1 Tax=Vibrio sp. SSH13-20 TaxID=3136668 RepID=UPI002A646018|nr:hypothetical protein [Vibrio harveyi]